MVRERLEEYGRSGMAWSEERGRWVVLSRYVDSKYLEKSREKNGGRAVVVMDTGGI